MFTQDQLDRMIGAEVIDVDGDKVGKIGQIYFDDITNQPSWVTVNTGFFGMNESFVPIDGADFDGEDVRVRYEKGLIKDAPNLDHEDGHLSREQEAELYRHYSFDYDAVPDGIGRDRLDRDDLGRDDVRRDDLGRDDLRRDDLRDDALARDDLRREDERRNDLLRDDERYDEGRERDLRDAEFRDVGVRDGESERLRLRRWSRDEEFRG